MSSCCYCNRRKRKVIPFFLWIKISPFSSPPNSSDRRAGRETVPLSSLYMSFELDTCSLRDVIVIADMCERNPLPCLASKKQVLDHCTDEKDWRGEKNTRIAAQIDPPLTCFYLRKEKRRMRRDNNYLSISCWLFYLHHHYQRVIVFLVGDRSKKCILLNDDNDSPCIISKKIHRELLPLCV